MRRTSRPGDRVETVFTVLAEESPGSIGQGGCQRQPGVTRGTVPQRTDRRFLREPVRVKRRCKRPPAFRVTGTARQTPPGARSRRARAGNRTNPRRRLRVARPMPAGGPLEPAGDGRPRWMVATRCNEHRDRTRLTGRLVRRLSCEESWRSNVIDDRSTTLIPRGDGDG